MHGRVKVRSTEEEMARKIKERQKKLIIFKEMMQKIHAKRNSGELDKSLLECTGLLLSTNPDIYTLWNMRREVLNSMRNSGGDNEEMPAMFNAELQLTEHCLKSNPKSYCAWHQRQWILTTIADPDWGKELLLCDKYLKFDERNFHTWDYRRFVVSQCKPRLEDEFDFTTEKVLDNFSNYSAWHYRSKMLIELYPDVQGGRPIEDSHHKHELQLVQSAAFTDPDDTSAWFYQRWLLSAVKETTQVIVCTITPDKTTVAFSKSIPHSLVKSNTHLFVDNMEISCEWVACTGNEYDCLWICEHGNDVTNDLDIKVEFDSTDECKQVIQCVKQSHNTYYIGKAKISFEKQFSQPVIEELKQQLNAAFQLLEMEPDNKWTLLTCTTFLRCIDPKLNHEQTIKNLHTLKKLDKLRHGYYDHLISKWNIEDMLTKCFENNEDNTKFVFDREVYSLPHLQYLSYCKQVDISNQSITSRCLPSLIMLQHCKHLNLENNQITTLKSFPKLELEVLNLQGNIIDPNEIEDFRRNTNINVLF